MLEVVSWVTLPRRCRFNTVTSFNIVLQDDVQILNQVVVTGYSSQRRADLTGAVSVVDMGDIANVSTNNVFQALQGRVPGMNITSDGNPGGKVNVQVRGISNLRTDKLELSALPL